MNRVTAPTSSVHWYDFPCFMRTKYRCPISPPAFAALLLLTAAIAAAGWFSLRNRKLQQVDSEIKFIPKNDLVDNSSINLSGPVSGNRPDALVLKESEESKSTNIPSFQQQQQLSLSVVEPEEIPSAAQQLARLIKPMEFPSPEAKTLAEELLRKISSVQDGVELYELTARVADVKFILGRIKDGHYFYTDSFMTHILGFDRLLIAIQTEVTRSKKKDAEWKVVQSHAPKNRQDSQLFKGGAKKEKNAILSSLQAERTQLQAKSQYTCDQIIELAYHYFHRLRLLEIYSHFFTTWWCDSFGVNEEFKVKEENTDTFEKLYSSTKNATKVKSTKFKTEDNQRLIDGLKILFNPEYYIDSNIPQKIDFEVIIPQFSLCMGEPLEIWSPAQRLASLVKPMQLPNPEAKTLAKQLLERCPKIETDSSGLQKGLVQNGVKLDQFNGRINDIRFALDLIHRGHYIYTENPISHILGFDQLLADIQAEVDKAKKQKEVWKQLSKQRNKICKSHLFRSQKSCQNFSQSSSYLQANYKKLIRILRTPDTFDSVVEKVHHYRHRIKLLNKYSEWLRGYSSNDSITQLLRPDGGLWRKGKVRKVKQENRQAFEQIVHSITRAEICTFETFTAEDNERFNTGLSILSNSDFYE